MLRSPVSLLAPALALLLSLFAALPALAHAQLLASNPAANALLAESPAQLELTYNEPVTALAMTLIGPDGVSADITPSTTAGATLAIPLPPSLADGTHVLSWRVISTDAHPVAGSLIFSVGHVTGAAEVAAAPTGSRATAILLWVSKALLFSALFVGVGGAVFALFAPLPHPARRLAALLALIGLVIAPLSLGLHGADALGADPDAMLGTAPWSTGFATSYGATVLALAASLALGAVALVHPRMAWLGWPAWLVGALALAMSGHAGSAAPQWLTRTAVTFHIAGILFWIGALLPIWFWLRDRRPEADNALRQFSRIIPLAVAAILVSGVTLAVIQMGPPGPAWLTPYGYLLAGKLGCLLVLFLLALWNRYRLTGSILLGELEPRLHLRRTILVELVLVLAILGLVSAWRFTPPPRGIAEADAAQAARSEPAYAHVMTDTLMVDVTAAPGRPGPVDFEIWLVDAVGDPVAPLAVEVTFAAPTLGIEPFSASATFADGFWLIQGQTIPLAGTWDVTLDIRLSRYAQNTLATQIEILP
ncbi:copper resistance CopC/CopD family protein [Devosia sediminis]|uniref:Copper resistance protein CopC/CopD n=1 Tax=Devosia sediminis TaxID=2798801 RepID=A0A934J091_9HYPH|nr:copper resistance protein CopC [Devosia sediminis]MBJ3785923.1 copper resistance protein CopC/CopD [Devosia sediminis]